MNYVYDGTWSDALRTNIQLWIDKKWAIWGEENPGTELTDFIQESLENKKSMEEFSADFLDLDMGEEKATELALELSELLKAHNKQLAAAENNKIEPYKTVASDSTTNNTTCNTATANDSSSAATPAAAASMSSVSNSLLGPLRTNRHGKTLNNKTNNNSDSYNNNNIRNQHDNNNNNNNNSRVMISSALPSSRNNSHYQSNNNNNNSNVYSRLGKRSFDHNNSNSDNNHDHQNNNLTHDNNNNQQRNVRQRQNYNSNSNSHNIATNNNNNVPTVAMLPNPLAEQLRYMEEMNRVAQAAGFANAKEMLQMTQQQPQPVAAATHMIHPGSGYYPPVVGGAGRGGGAYGTGRGGVGGRGRYHVSPHYGATHYHQQGPPAAVAADGERGNDEMTAATDDNTNTNDDVKTATAEVTDKVTAEKSEAAAHPIAMGRGGAGAGRGAGAYGAGRGYNSYYNNHNTNYHNNYHYNFEAFPPYGGRGRGGAGAGRGLGAGRGGVNPFAQQQQDALPSSVAEGGAESETAAAAEHGTISNATSVEAAGNEGGFLQDGRGRGGRGRGRRGGGRFNNYYNPHNAYYQQAPFSGPPVNKNKVWIRPTDVDSSSTAL